MGVEDWSYLECGMVRSNCSWNSAWEEDVHVKTLMALHVQPCTG